MNIAGLGRHRNVYSFPAKSTEAAKAEAAQTRPSQTDSVSVSKTDGAAYFDSLRQKFDCVKNGNVAISGSYLDKCAKDQELAQCLEENLAAYERCVQQGYQNAKLSAEASGGRLLSYSETWNIDGEGNLTMISRGTVEDDTGTTSWEKIRKDILKRIEKMRKEMAQKKPAIAGENEEEASESQGGKVAVNEGKRARQIAAAKCRKDVQRVIALLRKDMADCKAGLEQGWCDEAEINKVQALLNSAQARMSQVPEEAEEQMGTSEFDLAGLM